MARLLFSLVSSVFNAIFNPFAGRVRVPGTQITLQGRIWVFAPVPLGFIEENAARIEEFGNAAAMESGAISLTIDTALASLRRNYPFITRRRVRRMVDVASFQTIIAAAWGQIGAATGEPQAPAKSTGATSTPTSPPAPAGNSTISATN